MNFIFQYTHIYTTHTYNYIHIFVSHCIINVIVYGLGGGCSLKAVLPNTPITINIYEKSGCEYTESYPDRTLPTALIIVPSSRMASSPLTIIPQSISEQYMVELHSLPGRDTIFWYLADYVNTLSPI